MTKNTKHTILTLAILCILLALFTVILKSAPPVTETPLEPAATSTNEVRSETVTLTGTYSACLPRHDNFSTTACYEGMKTNDGSFYILDYNMYTETKPTFKSGDQFTATGLFTPIEMLSSSQWQDSIAKGIFSVQTIVIMQPAVTVPNTPPTQVKKCYVGGCSAQICSDSPDVASTCEYREQYACYKTAKCERQSNGQCGWTQSAELKACIVRTQ